MFTAVFKRSISIKNDTVNENERRVINLLKEQSGLNATEIALRLEKSIPTVKRYLSSLSKLGLIEFKGAPKARIFYAEREALLKVWDSKFYIHTEAKKQNIKE